MQRFTLKKCLEYVGEKIVMKKNIAIIAHAAFWIFYASLVGTGGYILSEGTEGWNFILNGLVFGLLVVYGNLFFIEPFLFKKNYPRFGMLGLAYVTTLIFIRLKTEHLFGLHLTDRFGWAGTFLLSVQILVLFVLSTMFGGFVQWLKDRERERFLEKEKLAGELKILKTQVNPHFLFNTLNNIYSLAYRQDPNTAPMVATLSKIMRYHLYDGSRERVSLHKEVEMLRDFIALQRLKFGDTLHVDFYSEGIGPHHEIAPLILINFIENSFKHGDPASNPSAFVNVNLTVEEGKLRFLIENSFQSPVAREEGFGLKNTERLLDLAYPGRHKMEVKNEQGVFSVNLEIGL